MDLIRNAGILGVLSILAMVLLLVPILAVRRPRSRWIALALLASTPLLIGAAGTALGMSHAHRVVDANPDVVTPAELAAAEDQALASTWLGLGCAAILLAVLGARLATATSDVE